MAIAYQTQYDALNTLRNGHILTDRVSYDDWSACMRPLIVEAQTQAIAMDATATAFLVANRKFVKNTDAVDRVLVYNDINYTFTAGKAYCVESTEWTFFLQQASTKGYGIVDDASGTSYLGGNGIVQFYYF